MINKPLIAAVAGFLAGGLLVSIAATTFDKPAEPDTTNSNVSMSQMTEMLKPLKGDAFDKAFLEHMIAHHQEAIDMAQLAATNAKHEEIKQLANDILSAHSKEINQMQTWQTNWGYKSMSNNMQGMNH